MVSIGAALISMTANAAGVGEMEVKRCIADVLQTAGGGQCWNYFVVETVRKVDARQASSEANVIADIDIRVRARLAGKSPGAVECTGTGWSVQVKNPHPPNTGQWFMYQAQADMDGGYLEPDRRLRVRKNFKFERWESGWRRATGTMSPIEKAWFLN